MRLRSVQIPLGIKERAVVRFQRHYDALSTVEDCRVAVLNIAFRHERSVLCEHHDAIVESALDWVDEGEALDQLDRL